MSDLIVTAETPVTVVFTNKLNDQVIQREETTAQLIPAVAVRVSVMFNALTNSGGVSWRHPRTGETYPRGISWHVELIHPDTGEVVTAVPS